MNSLGVDFATFSCLTEPLVWAQDAAPHRRGTFGGAVVKPRADTPSAGHPDGYVRADEYHVYISDENQFLADMTAGDTLERIHYKGETLTIQNITRKPVGYMLTCTANERPPTT